ncbi:type VI secretion system tip protein VgrG [Enterobacteriaceae bacterium YMB-R22]|nr:type VI secretion system tip protein VgrG [Tenebrionicola larvae]
MGMADYIMRGGQHGVYNPYQLRLKKLSKARPDIQVSVLKFSGTEALNQIPRYEIEFTSATPDIPGHLLINYTAELLMYPDGEVWETLTPRVIPGIITEFRQCNTSADITRYVAVLEHRMARMAQGRNSAVWLNESIISLTEKTFSNHLIDKLSFAFKLATRYPLRDFMLQYEEADYLHVARRLANAGVAFYRQYDEENNEDVIVLTDHTHGWVKGPALPYRHPAGVYDAGKESVWDMQVIRTAVPKQVVVNDDNYQQAQSDMKAEVKTDEDYRALWAEEYRWAEHYPEAGRAYEAQPGQGGWYAGLRRERHRSKLITFEGKSNAMRLRPGMIITTPGKDWPDAPDGLLIVSTACHNIARDASYFITFTAVPWSIQYTWRPEELPWPAMSGTLSARISSTTENDIYSHIDAQGRYRIRFDPDRGEWQKGFESCWVRLAKPYAGDDYGFHCPLLDGTGVRVAFENGDPDRPYISHVMHDSRHGDHVTQQNHKRNILRTPAKNTLLMDDWRGHEFIHLSTPHSGNSELNLGHLVSQGREKRGEGFELRSDGWGALRAGKGLFISTDLRAQGASEQLDMKEAQRQLKDALNLAQSLHEAASVAKAELADLNAQKALLTQSLDELKQAALLLSSPAGIAATTPKTVQLHAGDNLTVTANNQADFSALKKITLAAGKAISLFARESGMKFFAAKGNVELQAQSDEMHLSSLKDMTVTSHGGKTIIAAKDELLLTCGGAFIRIKGGKIEYGSPGNQTVKAANWIVSGPEKMDITHQSWPQSVPKQKLRFLLGDSPESPVRELAGEPYKLYANGALIQQGVTGAGGSVEIDHQVATNQYRLELPGGEIYEINMVNEGQTTEADKLAAQGYRITDPTQTQDANGLGKDWRNVFHSLLNPQTDDDNGQGA